MDFQNLFQQGVHQAEDLFRQQLREQQNELKNLQQQQAQREAQIRHETMRLLQQQHLLDLAEKLKADSPEFLRKKLREEPPVVRLFSILVISGRRLPLQTELLEALKDPSTPVRQAAHGALIRISRGTDFGPYPGASQRSVERSIAKWRNWLALQQEASLGSNKRAAIAAGKLGKVDPIQPVQLLLDDSNHELQTLRPEVTRLCDELVNAKSSEQRSVLARWRDGSSSDHNDALVLAIPKLPEALRVEAEGALSERLRRLSPATLRDKLQDDNMELRRAAAFACGRKLARDLIPDLVQLLEDPEKDVIQAARAALTELTGEDFGPSKDANERGRTEAVAAWRKWCKEHTSALK